MIPRASENNRKQLINKFQIIALFSFFIMPGDRCLVSDIGASFGLYPGSCGFPGK